MTDRRRGFSLLELMIAVFILSLCGLAFFQMLRASGSKQTLSANTLSGNYVATKVMTDVAEDARLNVTLLPLMEDFTELTTPDRVVEGQSVYFRHMHDSAAPWGSISPAVDGGFTTLDGDLYHQLKEFSVGVSAKRPTAGGPESRHLAEITVSVDWKERDGQKRSYSLQTLVPSPVGAVPLASISLVPEPDLPAAMREYLYPDHPGLSLDQAIQATGGDRAMVLDLGRVAVTTDRLLVGVASMAQQVQALRQQRDALTRPPTLALPPLQARLAGSCEAIAAALYVVLRDLEPSLRRIESGYRTEKLGSLYPGRALSGLVNFQRGVQVLPGWVEQAAREYDWLLSDSLRAVRPGRIEEYARTKALEAFRLLASLVPARQPLYQGFVTTQAQTMTGRNPYWERLFVREAGFARRPAALRQAFDNLAEVVRVYEDALVPLASLTTRVH